MKKVFGLAALGGLGGFLLASCGGDFEGYDEGVGSVQQDVSKCAGGKLGASNYCSATCKCVAAEGDCDSDAECVAPSVCSGNLSYFATGLVGNACAPAHCRNKRIDGNETQIDCGGSCGTFCPNACLGITANGTTGHCKADCPCPAREGDCDLQNNRCQPGLVCTFNTGAAVGLASSVDLCLGATCSNRVLDGTETGVDCGGNCLPCSNTPVQSAVYGGAENDHGLGVATDGANNIIVAGRFAGTASFGGAAITSTAGSADVYVAKYNSSGVFLRNVRFGSDAPEGDNGVSVAADASNNVYIAGNFYAGHPVTFGATTLTSAGLSDIFVIKLDPNFNVLWARSFGGAGTDRANGIAVVGTGVYVTGGFQGTVNFGGGARTSAGSSDAFALKLGTAAGAFSYAQTAGGAAFEQAYGIAVDNLGSAYIAGTFTGAASFGGLPATSVGSTDAFLWRLSPTGASAWVRSFGGSSNDSAQAVVLDADREPTVVGNFKQTVNFGDGAPVAAVGGTDAFAVKYTVTGVFRWKQVIASDESTSASAAVITSAGNVAVVGDFAGTVDFGSGAVSAGAGNRWLYVAIYNRLTGAFVSSNTQGGTGSVRPYSAARAGSVLAVTGDATGTINLGGSNLMTNGGTDMFLGRFIN